MVLFRDGTAGAPGIVIGPVRVVRWEIPDVPHTNVPDHEVDSEIELFRRVRTSARKRLEEIRDRTARKLGKVEARIFDPQLLMLDDPALVEGTERYIRENHLSAARAFSLQVLQFQSAWRRTAHPMMMDRLNDLLDVEMRVLCGLLGRAPPDLIPNHEQRKFVLVVRELTPTITAQLDPSSVLGIAMDRGTRTSHSLILARAMNLPTVLNLGDITELVKDGDEIILDGRGGRVLISPTHEDKSVYRERESKAREWEQELLLLAHTDPLTADKQPVVVRANIDIPAEANTAKAHGAQGIGLLRTEFLVVGRSTMPDEEEQYTAYRDAVAQFPDQPVYIRTFDLGGDKFPVFLKMPPEENPFLGWRAIRLCIDSPALFRTQLRALLRATAHGDVRIMLPLVNEIEEIKRTKELLDEEAAELNAAGVDVNPDYQLGIMVETPAAALTADRLASHVDFFSIGTNDLVQYTLAVDRDNARLAPRYSPFHPAVLELIRRTVKVGRDAGIEVTVCGEMASQPLGLFFLIGIGITTISLAPASLPEAKQVLRSVPAVEAKKVAKAALAAHSREEALCLLKEGVSNWVDLSHFSGY